MLIDVSLRQAGRDGKCGVIDFSIVTPAAESYCAQAAKIPLHAAKTREETKKKKYFQAYKALDDTHFEPFVVESGGELGVRAPEKKYSRRSAILSPNQRAKVDLLLHTSGNQDSLSHLRRSRIPMHSDGQWHITNQGIQTVYQST